MENSDSLFERYQIKEKSYLSFYKVSLSDKVIAEVPFGSLELFLKSLLRCNDSVNVSLDDLRIENL